MGLNNKHIKIDHAQVKDMKVTVTFHNDIFTPWPATSIIHPVETLLEAGHEVTVISWDKGRGEKIMDATLPVKRLRVHSPVTGSRSLFAFSRKLSSKIVGESPDLILAFDLEVLEGSSRAAESLGIPLLFFAREDWPAMVKRNGDIASVLRSKVFSSMERRICKRNVTHAYAVNDERGAKYIKWGVPYTTILTTRGLSELPVPNEKHKRLSLALAGSMHELNALGNILEAIKDIDCDLYLIGGNEENMKSLRVQVEASGIEDRVFITGRLNRDEFYQQLSKCHIGLTLPFNTDENKFFGITVKTWDYLSMAMPVVSSDFPAMRKVVKGNEIGEVVDPTSPDEIRKAVLRLKDETQTLGKKARKLFEDQFCWDMQKLKLKDSHWIFRGSQKD